jgi:hypothetical protein
MMRATDIASGAPTWVYILLVALIVLGVRRLRTRDMPAAVALIAPAAFLIWSVMGDHAFANRAGLGVALSAWLAGIAVGALTGVLLPDPRGERLPNGRVRLPGSWLPLLLYIGVFVVRFACGAWAAIVPQHAILATAVGIAVGAAMTARLVVGIARWRSASTL